MSYLLDTNICIHYLKGQHDLDRRVADAGAANCFLSEITLAELWFGIENGAREKRQKNRERVTNFLDGFTGRILPIGQSLHEYARQKAALRRIGRPVGDFDTLIGATTIAYKLTLVTCNVRHFADMDGIALENWVDA